MEPVRALGLFVLAGLLEIGGGYLVWRWLRQGDPWWAGLIGAIALAGYGAVATLQPAGFGRVYAAYGGIFVAMALLWGWLVDRRAPDRFDLVGSGIAVAGMCVILYAPRR